MTVSSSVSTNMLPYVSGVKKITMLVRSILQWIKRPFCRALKRLGLRTPLGVEIDCTGVPTHATE